MKILLVILTMLCFASALLGQEDVRFDTLILSIDTNCVKKNIDSGELLVYSNIAYHVDSLVTKVDFTKPKQAIVLKRKYKEVKGHFRVDYKYKALEPVYYYLVYVPEDTMPTTPNLISLFQETKYGTHKNIVSFNFPNVKTRTIYHALDCHFLNQNHVSFLRRMKDKEVIGIKSTMHNADKMDSSQLGDGQECTIKIEKIDGVYYASYKLYSFHYINYGGPGRAGPPRTPDHSVFSKRVRLSESKLKIIEAFENKVVDYAISNGLLIGLDRGRNTIEFRNKKLYFESENFYALDLWNKIVVPNQTKQD